MTIANKFLFVAQIAVSDLYSYLIFPDIFLFKLIKWRLQFEILSIISSRNITFIFYEMGLLL